MAQATRIALTSQMSRKTCLKLTKKQEKALSPAELQTLTTILKLFDKWRRNFRIHPDVQLNLHYNAKTKKCLMETTFKNAEYHRYKITISKKMLSDDQKWKSEATVIHELLHVMLYPYTRIAENTNKGSILDEMRMREEEVVCSIENALVNLVLSKSVKARLLAP